MQSACSHSVALRGLCSLARDEVHAGAVYGMVVRDAIVFSLCGTSTFHACRTCCGYGCACAAVTLRRCALGRMSVTVRCSVAQHSTGACVLARRRACAMRWRTRMPGIVLSRAWPGTALAGTLGLAVPPSEVLGAAAQARQTPMLLGNPCSYSYPNSTTHNGSSLTVPHGP